MQHLLRTLICLLTLLPSWGWQTPHLSIDDKEIGIKLDNYEVHAKLPAQFQIDEDDESFLPAENLIVCEFSINIKRFLFVDRDKELPFKLRAFDVDGKEYSVQLFLQAVHASAKTLETSCTFTLVIDGDPAPGPMIIEGDIPLSLFDVDKNPLSMPLHEALRQPDRKSVV